MATRAAARLFEELLDRYGPEVASAFMRALDDLRAGADFARLVDAIDDGDIEAALETLNLDAAAYDDLLDTIQRAYQESGRGAAELLPRRDPDGLALAIRFSGRNPTAERWVRDQSSSLITRLDRDSRAVVRASLTDSLAAGINPRTAGIRLVGAINPATGRREGGVLGLSGQQERYVAIARTELASDDPASLRAYLERKRRDKRFDRTIEKAIRDGTPVPADVQRKALAAYERRLLALRGEMIGRTETLAALNAASYEAIRQAVESGKIPASAVRRVWRSAGDLRVRHTHRGLNADTVGLTQPFRSPSGALMLYPGDTSLGAPASETIGCRCVVENRVDWLSNLR